MTDRPECVAIENVEPIFVEQMILGAMAHRYMARVADLSLDDGLAAARATWEADMGWENPRDFEQAIAMVDADLEHRED